MNWPTMFGMADIRDVFRYNLRRLMGGRKQLGIAAASKSEGRGVTQQYLQALLAGDRINPTLRAIGDIATALGVDADELLDVRAYERSLKKSMPESRRRTGSE